MPLSSPASSLLLASSFTVHVYLTRLFPCFLIFPSSLLLPSLNPRFGVGTACTGYGGGNVDLDMVLRAGLPAPALWLEEVRRIAAGSVLRDGRTAGNARSAGPMESRFSADSSPQARTGPECGTRKPFEMRRWTAGAHLSNWRVDSAITSELRHSSGVSAHPS